MPQGPISCSETESESERHGQQRSRGNAGMNSSGAPGFELGIGSFGMENVHSMLRVTVQVGGSHMVKRCCNGGRVSFPYL